MQGSMDLEATWLQGLSMQQLTGQVSQLRGVIRRQQLPQQRQLLHLRLPSCSSSFQGAMPILLRFIIICCVHFKVWGIYWESLASLALSPGTQRFSRRN